jgi:ABC-2 type transport system ATP-binding protein
MLEVRSVRKIYDDRVVVNDVSFSVQGGELFALLGPNGAGKTTLIRMITDITRPDAGDVLLEGKPVTAADRPRIAYLPEERGLYRKVPVLDALSYYGELKDMAPRAARAQAVELLEEFGLAAWAKKQVQQLSKGMQQKLQICTTLIANPRLLILDEPFSGLDPVNVQLLEDVLRKRRAAGCTVLLSTHQINRVEKLCDRALMIFRGHAVLHGTVREIRRQHAEHAVIVRGGDVPPGVAGVTRSERLDDGATKLVLARDTTHAAVAKALVHAGVPLESYTPAEPPLEDIFVSVVNAGVGLDQGRSGKLTVDEAEDLLGGTRNGGAR